MVWCYDANTDGSYGGTNEGTHYYCQDANFNVTAVVKSDSTVLERYNYTPYGTPTILDPDFADDANQISDIGNTHLYTGRERDPETGLQLNRHRYYASHLGRWLTRDPLAFAMEVNLTAIWLSDVADNPISEYLDNPDAFIDNPGLLSSEYTSDGPNLYEYVHGMPPSLTDSSGMAWWWPPDWFPKKPPKPPKPPGGGGGGGCPRCDPPPGQPKGCPWRVPDPPPGGWQNDPPTIVGCYLCCWPCNKGKSQPVSGCQSCCRDCHGHNKANCPKKPATARIMCEVAAEKAENACETACTMGGKLPKGKDGSGGKYSPWTPK